MEVTKYPIYEVFERSQRYMVPLFQRSYVWEEEGQWSHLWQDIVDRAHEIIERDQRDFNNKEIKNHFLGAIVLNKMDTHGRQVPAFEIIDGQQRLTTLQIMLAAFRDVVRNSTCSENEEADLKKLADDINGLTINSSIRETEEEIFKVWPTKADQESFKTAMTAGSIEEIEKQHPLQYERYARRPNPRPRLIETYCFFAESIQVFCSPADTLTENTNNSSELHLEFSMKHAHALYEALKRQIYLVVIELEKQDDPQIIFETLNARGVPLLASDLIRNFIFYRANQQGEISEDLYEKWWSEYDEREAEHNAAQDDISFWRQTERQGRARRTRLDLFIHFYVQYRSEQDQGGVEHVYNAFRAWWDSDKERRVSDELQELRRHSDVFASLMVPEGDSRLDIFATRLKQFDTSTLYPVLLMLLVDGQERTTEEDLDGIITDLESYLVRRMVCELGTKNYNRFFLSMLQQLRDLKPITRTCIQDFLMEPTGSAGEWPNDKKFAEAWMECAASEMLGNYRCNIILSAIEQTMWNKKQERITVDSPLTVEHVMPRNWESAWPAPTYINGEEEWEIRSRLVHSFGNLTLLTQGLNSTVSNGSYDAKKPEITKQSALRLNTYFQDISTWNEDEIRKRGKELFKHAQRIWPYPKKKT